MALSKQEKERRFHNRAFAEQTRQQASPFYSVIRASRLFFEDQIQATRGGDVLEYGCGPGTYSFFLAAAGCNVTGIDISEVALAQARERAERERLTITFRQMDAERLEFADNTFDTVCGVAILHHLDLRKAFSGLARVLRPGGRAVFMEPLGHNPAINLYRRLTPHLRTEDEHPLVMKDLEIARDYFGKVEVRFFTLQSLLAVPFQTTCFFLPLVKTLDAADAGLFKVLPPLRRYAWQAVPVLSNPKKTSHVPSYRSS
jgi:SAM-dependent methyltransferase